MSDQSRDIEADDGKGDSFGEVVRTIIYALLIAIVFRTFVFQSFTIPSSSMMPTLLIGDYLLVSKYSYGYSRFSLPFGSRIPSALFGGRIFSGEPERGDVIVFRNPADPREDYIKRLIGLPGDEIEIRQGVVFVNGTALSQSRTEPFVDGDGGSNCPRSPQFGGQQVCPQQIETLDNGVSHAIIPAATPSAYADNTCSYTVPEGHYFFLGDYRNNSQDSRFGHQRDETGVDCAQIELQFTAGPYLPNAGPAFVPADHLIGRADVVLFSSAGSFFNVFSWRSDRFFLSID